MLELGIKAPDFELPDQDGVMHKFRQRQKDQDVFKKVRCLFKKAPFLFLKGRYFFEKALALFRRCPRLFEGVSGALEHKPAKSDEELKMYSPTHFSRLNNLLLYRYSFLRC